MAGGTIPADRGRNSINLKGLTIIQSMQQVRSAGILRPEIRPACIVCLGILALCLIPAGVSAAVHASTGDTIHLSGTAYSTDVYLFLTGPNLPSDGAALDPASGGGYTMVSVDADNRWNYAWDTHRPALDAGTYSIWVVDAPVGVSGLSGHDYSRITVTLSRPSVSISGDRAVVPGTLRVTAVPENSSVVVNGEYRGETPLVVTGLFPATYPITISHFGYRPVTRPVAIESGATTVMNVSLAPYPGSIRVDTEPPGTRILLDGSVAGISPLTLEDVPAGIHTITAEREGYTNTESTVTVAGNRTASLSLTLERPGIFPSATRAGDPVSCGIAMLISFVTASILPRHKKS